MKEEKECWQSLREDSSSAQDVAIVPRLVSSIRSWNVLYFGTTAIRIQRSAGKACGTGVPLQSLFATR
jgi:hypothetical protein